MSCEFPTTGEHVAAGLPGGDVVGKSVGFVDRSIVCCVDGVVADGVAAPPLSFGQCRPEP